MAGPSQGQHLAPSNSAGQPWTPNPGSSAASAIDLDVAEQQSQEAARLRIVVLCGPIGSGKSTLSKAWCTLKPGWTRVCQDELGNRQSCEQMCRYYLSQGLSCIIDRQNFDNKQRAHWVSIARSFNAEVCALVFSTPAEECARRLSLRQDHPTIATPQKALAVLPMSLRAFRMPTDAEGFDRIARLPDLPPSPAVEDIDRILSLLTAAPKQSRLDSLFRPPPPRTFAPPPVNAWRSGGAPAFRQNQASS